jgi:23S rRNA (cytosine1962-C5)-methyltransferase
MAESAVVVSKKGEARIRRGHPWVFRSDVTRADDAFAGCVVRVLGSHNRPLGFAFFSSQSQITLRMIHRGETLPDSFLQDRLAAAIRWRETVAAGAEACRLVHGEGDGLPSLVVDRYRDHLVVQTLSQATDRLKGEILTALQDLLGPAGVLERNDPRVRELEGLDRKVDVLAGHIPEVIEVLENGVRFEVDLRKGQKTGLFLDQRENHAMARAYARGRVLDGFTYNGGFALHVAPQASEVMAVDVSAEAVERVRRNAERNGATNVVAREANAFDLLHELYKQGERFDTVILDPPAFAKSKDAVEKAWRGYKEINLRALQLLPPGGCLITCSCSYHVDEAAFEEIVWSAARDHPIVLGVPETYYLKCLVLRKLS